jgi:arylsulfatase A-like enzyme
MILGPLLALALQDQPSAPVDAMPAPAPTPDIALILLDDVGMDMIGGTFQEVPDAPSTPNIDRLATDGVFFRNAWANPHCSPTRATLMTGRYAFRTGIGTWIDAANDTWGLQPSEDTLPDRLHLSGYTSAAFGKWHMAVHAQNGVGQGLGHPFACGFDTYRGAMSNPDAPPFDCSWPNYPAGCLEPFDYCNWAKNSDGDQACTQTYLTADTVDDAVDFLQTPPEPFFLYVPFNAIHTPHHDPSGQLPPMATERDLAKAMMEALDAEIGRLLIALDYPNPNLYVIVLGDNGTNGSAAWGAPAGTGCFGAWRSKGTLYEGGVNVPLIIAGPGVVSRETAVPVNSTDVFATICDLGSVAHHAADARSLTGVMFGSEEPVRKFVYAERFTPNGPFFNPVSHTRAVFDGRYKLIRHTDISGTSDLLFDLELDPCEQTNLLLVDLSPTQEAAYMRLDGHLADLGVE